MNAAEIRDFRLRLGMTQEELARELGVSFVTVNHWEMGVHKPQGAAKKMLQMFKEGKKPNFIQRLLGRH